MKKGVCVCVLVLVLVHMCVCVCVYRESISVWKRQEETQSLKYCTTEGDTMPVVA